MVAELAKGLKPKKLKIDQVRKSILAALRAEGEDIKKELEKTTATWEGSKPTFEIEVDVSGGNAVVLIGPGGNTEGAQKWVWLDEGTKPHVIKAKNVPNLVFRTNFTPKTKVKTFASGRGSISPPWRATPQVKHPGIEAREWSKEIAKRRKKKFIERMIKAARV